MPAVQSFFGLDPPVVDNRQVFYHEIYDTFEWVNTYKYVFWLPST